MGGRVEAVDDPVLASRAAGGAEDFFTEISGEGLCRVADAGQELLVGGLVPRLDLPVTVGVTGPADAGGRVGLAPTGFGSSSCPSCKFAGSRVTSPSAN